ncbi:MAG: ORF6N domain-containing protein [Hallella sp.]|nr:ORF6N domain-containing protein [Hallella sp.]
MANNIDKKESVANCDQSKIDVTKCDNHELAGNIEPLIKVIRGQQVMLDKDLAMLYGVEVKVLNQAVKRNVERFPNDFRFQLTKEECLRSQIVTLNGKQGQHLKYMPYAFTEQGVAMLSSVLRSKTAIEVNIQIMRAFVSMRHFMVNNASVFSRLETIEYHQLEMQQHLQESDKRIDEVFRRLDEGNAKPKQGVFYNGQIYDAYTFVSDLIKSAKKRIVLIDNYVDETVLTLLDKRENDVSAVIYTQQISRQFQLDIDRHNAQYAPIDVETFRLSHDRFLCIDDDVYHIGASIKDLGKKWFGFSKMEILTPDELVERINKG